MTGTADKYAELHAMTTYAESHEQLRAARVIVRADAPIVTWWAADPTPPPVRRAPNGKPIVPKGRRPKP